MLRYVTALLLALLILLPCGGCSTNPATGRAQFNVLSEEEEIAIGEKSAPEFLAAYGGELPQEEVVAYTRDLGARLAEVSERPDLPWEFHVLNSPVINAFALPGGKVFMSRGLMEKLTNEAQLAGVLGHEVGHVTAQHIGQQMSQRVAVSAGLIALGIGAQFSDEDWVKVVGVGAGVGGTVYLLSYGRGQELQADELGVRYMARLQYNPLGQVQVMEVLKAASGGGGGIEMLSTHPLPDTRIKKLRKRIANEYPDADDYTKYHFYQDRFEREVLAKLKDLPPAPAPKQQANASHVDPLDPATYCAHCQMALVDASADGPGQPPRYLRAPQWEIVLAR